MKKPSLSARAPCPCDSGQPYADCCGPWHAGLTLGVHAPTPEALMRSRYSAYVLGLIDYLLATWHASTSPGDLELSPVKWLGLEVRHAQSTGDAGVVEFVAYYRSSNRSAGPPQARLAPSGGQRATRSERTWGQSTERLHETSRFVRTDGRWYYIDGQMDDSA